MTRDEIMTLGFEELEERANAIAVETAEADKDQLETLNAELDAIEERKKALNIEIEERKKAAEAVAHGAGTKIEERKEKKMTDREIRSTQEYIDAYVAYVKSGYDVKEFEKRMPDVGGGDDSGAILYSKNTVNGTIAVPVYVEDRINANWENNEILRRVKRTFFPGNVQVGVEINAPMAGNHAEGSDAILAEALEIQFVDLIPQYIKKMIKVSHTALELSGTAFLDYLYDEIEAKIFERLAANVIMAMENSDLVESYNYAGNDVTTADIINAAGLLGANARPVLVIDRSTAAALKAAALTAQYGYDPFDGLEVIYANTTTPFVADLSAVQVNFPNGDVPRFIFDEYTDAPSNVVRIIGRMAAAVAVVAKDMIVKIIHQ